MEIKKNFNIKNLTSFKCGGDISEVYYPESVDELCLAINNGAMVLGNLSNILISDAGYDGGIILTPKVNKFEIKKTKVYAECGVKGPLLAKEVAKYGLSGMEFMIGFPGSIGGEIFMNAGANGQEISKIIDSVKCYSKSKGVFILNKDELEFGYRKSILQKEDYSVLSAEFKLKQSDVKTVDYLMKKNLIFRKEKQPSLSLPNCGSVFRNPEGASAGKLLDEAGAKNISFGGARVWENHANFVINDGGTSLDVLKVVLAMYNSVKEKFGIELKPEFKYLGGRDIEEVGICIQLGIM